MKLDFDNLSRQECHELLVSMILPRPIAWVSTVGEDGTFNLAPFSFFAGVSTKPPILCLSISRRKGQKKDTLRNIEYARDFVVNVADEALAESMNQSSVDYPSNISEFKETGLTPLSSDKVRSPKVAESPISMECKLLRILEFGKEPDIFSLVFGEIVRTHVKDALYRDGAIDTTQLKAIGRMGGVGVDLYCRTRDVFEMERPKYP